MTAADLFTKRLRPAEVAVGQLLDLAHAQVVSAHGQDERLHLETLERVHAHNRSTVYM